MYMYIIALKVQFLVIQISDVNQVPGWYVDCVGSNFGVQASMYYVFGLQ